MRRSISKMNGDSSTTIIKEKQFIYNTDLVTEAAFKLHLQLYNNYINQTNKKMNDYDLDVYNANSILLHQWFFENIGNTNILNSNFILEFFNNNFGSYQNWIDNFTKLCNGVRPSGWVALIYDFVTKKFKNIKIVSHDCHVPFGCNTILIIDLFEHSFLIDYGINRLSYINKFLDCINWNIVEQRIMMISKRLEEI